MKSKSYMIFLLAVFSLSCEKMEITRSDRSAPKGTEEMARSSRPPACALPDAAVSSFIIDHLVGDNLSYHFTVTNFGTGDLPLSSMYFQAYLSTDDIFDITTDVPAGGSIFTTAPILASGDSFSQAWSYGTTPSVNLTDYHFLIIQLQSVDGVVPEECSIVNNVSIHDLGCN